MVVGCVLFWLVVFPACFSSVVCVWETGSFVSVKIGAWSVFAKLFSCLSVGDAVGCVALGLGAYVGG